MKTLCTLVFLLCALIGVWLGQKPAPLSPCESGVVYPEDFGAVGDGVHDDSEAIQKAMDASSNCDKPATLRLRRFYKVSGPTMPTSGNAYNYDAVEGHQKWEGAHTINSAVPSCPNGCTLNVPTTTPATILIRGSNGEIEQAEVISRSGNIVTVRRGYPVKKPATSSAPSP